MKQIKPVRRLVLARVDSAPTKTASGLYLAKEAQEKPQTATVKAIGPKVEDIKVGDQIIYESYSGTDIKHQGQDHVLVSESKVLAVLT